MKKNIQKTRSFPSLSKIVFFACLERSGTVPDGRIHFFFVFGDFWPKMVAKRGPKKWHLFCILPPGTHQNRICDATSIFHRFCIDFGPHFHWFLVLLGPILGCFYTGSPFSPFPKYLPTNTDSPVSSQGCGGLRPAHTIWLLASFLRPFSKKDPCENQCWIWTRKSDEHQWKIDTKIVLKCLGNRFENWSSSKSA